MAVEGAVIVLMPLEQPVRLASATTTAKSEAKRTEREAIEVMVKSPFKGWLGRTVAALGSPSSQARCHVARSENHRVLSKEPVCGPPNRTCAHKGERSCAEPYSSCVRLRIRWLSTQPQSAIDLQRVDGRTSNNASPSCGPNHVLPVGNSHHHLPRSPLCLAVEASRRLREAKPRMLRHRPARGGPGGGPGEVRSARLPLPRLLTAMEAREEVCGQAAPLRPSYPIKQPRIIQKMPTAASTTTRHEMPTAEPEPRFRTSSR